MVRRVIAAPVCIKIAPGARRSLRAARRIAVLVNGVL